MNRMSTTKRKAESGKRTHDRRRGFPLSAFRFFVAGFSTQESEHARNPLHDVAVVLAVCLGVALLAGKQCDAAPRSARQKRLDDSIVQALKYISSEQQPSGAWRIRSYGESTAATSLAVMAFMAAGHVPGEGPYGKQMERGIQWVIDRQAANGMLVHAKSHGPMYSHGISSLMLAEVVGMLGKSQAKNARRALEKAIKLILDAQSVAKDRRHAGGWRYNATSRDSDLSVTGWQLLALRAAKNAGCDVPADSIARAVNYVKNCRPRSSPGFAYQPGGGPSPTRTGTGILALEVCGEHESAEALAAGDYLLGRPLRNGDHYFFYGVYYCSVGMFKLGGKYWTETRNNLDTILLDQQGTDGSWSARGSEQTYGKIYCSSMAVLALAIEYRYLPIYQR